MKTLRIWPALILCMFAACTIPGVEKDKVYTDGSHEGFSIGDSRHVVFDTMKARYTGHTVRLFWTASRRDQLLRQYNDEGNRSDTQLTWTRTIGSALEFPAPAAISDKWAVLIDGNPKNVVVLTFQRDRLFTIRRTRVLFSRP